MIYKQPRVGLNGEIFTLYKFRTINNKGEISPFCKFLRKYHIDELPQLYNVLKGDMNLIGPRPERPEIYIRLPDKFNNRIKVKPGVTGLAQVKLGYVDVQSLKHMKKKLRYDLFYIKHKNICLDLYIILLTFLKLGNGK